MDGLPSGPSVSPSKPREVALSREARSEQLKESGLVIEMSLAAFQRQFLDNITFSPKTTQSKTDLNGLVSKFASQIENLPEAAAYEPMTKMLNSFCDSYHRTEKIRKADQIVFIDHHTHPPCHHPQPYTDERAQQKPDILALKKIYAEVWSQDVEIWNTGNAKKKPAVAWALLHSFLEGKKEKGDHLYQAGVYGGSLLQSRPDLPGNFSIAYSSTDFSLLWSDPCGVYHTRSILWSSRDACDVLLAYIHFLHHPIIFDSTVTMQKPSLKFDRLPVAQWSDKSYACLPTWIFKCDDTEYEVKYLISVGEPWSRMNMVWESTRYGQIGKPRAAGPTVIIKDSFRDSRHLPHSTEGSILDKIHLDGEHVPGVAIKIEEFIVCNGDDPITNVDLNKELEPRHVHGRTKIRTLFDGSVQESLITSTSIDAFLRSMYDILEILQYIHERRKVMHRDVSAFNILRPSKRKLDPKTQLVKDPPIFISSLLAYGSLDGDREEFLKEHNVSSCLLIDFDNAVCDGIHKGIPRTGTPAFIAQSVCLQKAVGNNCQTLPSLCDLSEKAKASYIALHGEKCYKQRGLLHINAGPPIPKADFMCTPRHDAESCFWVIVWWIMQALPAKCTQADDVNAMKYALDLFDRHRISSVKAKESRVAFFNYDLEDWQNMLHPDLRSFAPFLLNLATVVYPNYDVFPHLDPYNLHEAMKRLILEQVWSLRLSGDPVALSEDRRSINLTPIKGHGATRIADLSRTKFDASSAQRLAEAAKKLASSKRKRDDQSSIMDNRSNKKSKALEPKANDATPIHESTTRIGSSRVVLPRAAKKSKAE